MYKCNVDMYRCRGLTIVIVFLALSCTWAQSEFDTEDQAWGYWKDNAVDVNNNGLLDMDPDQGPTQEIPVVVVVWAYRDANLSNSESYIISHLEARTSVDRDVVQFPKLKDHWCLGLRESSAGTVDPVFTVVPGIYRASKTRAAIVNDLKSGRATGIKNELYAYAKSQLGTLLPYRANRGKGGNLVRFMLVVVGDDLIREKADNLPKDPDMLGVPSRANVQGGTSMWNGVETRFMFAHWETDATDKVTAYYVFHELGHLVHNLPDWYFTKALPGHDNMRDDPGLIPNLAAFWKEGKVRLKGLSGAEGIYHCSLPANKPYAYFVTNPHNPEEHIFIQALLYGHKWNRGPDHGLAIIHREAGLPNKGLYSEGNPNRMYLIQPNGGDDVRLQGEGKLVPGNTLFQPDSSQVFHRQNNHAYWWNESLAYSRRTCPMIYNIRRVTKKQTTPDDMHDEIAFDAFIGNRDADWDRDGVKNEAEILRGSNPLLADSNGDRIFDKYDVDTDTDGDEIWNAYDYDDDGDGIIDTIDMLPENGANFRMVFTSNSTQGFHFTPKDCYGQIVPSQQRTQYLEVANLRQHDPQVRALYNENRLMIRRDGLSLQGTDIPQLVIHFHSAKNLQKVTIQAHGLSSTSGNLHSSYTDDEFYVVMDMSNKPAWLNQRHLYLEIIFDFKPYTHGGSAQCQIKQIHSGLLDLNENGVEDYLDAINSGRNVVVY